MVLPMVCCVEHTTEGEIIAFKVLMRGDAKVEGHLESEKLSKPGTVPKIIQK